MKLYEYPGKKVRIIDDVGMEFVGVAWDYVYPEDNDPEVEAIILDDVVRGDGHKYSNPIQFNETEIKSIEIIP